MYASFWKNFGRYCNGRDRTVWESLKETAKSTQDDTNLLLLLLLLLFTFMQDSTIVYQKQAMFVGYSDAAILCLWVIHHYIYTLFPTI